MALEACVRHYDVARLFQDNNKSGLSDEGTEGSIELTDIDIPRSH